MAFRKKAGMPGSGIRTGRFGLTDTPHSSLPADWINAHQTTFLTHSHQSQGKVIQAGGIMLAGVPVTLRPPVRTRHVPAGRAGRGEEKIQVDPPLSDCRQLSRLRPVASAMFSSYARDFPGGGSPMKDYGATLGGTPSRPNCWASSNSMGRSLACSMHLSTRKAKTTPSRASM